MNKFNKKINEIMTSASKEGKNINIGIMGLNEIYNNLTEEQKHNSELNEIFVLVLNNLIK